MEGAAASGGERLPTLQVLRAAAVLMVVLFHLMTIEGRFGGGSGLLPAASELGMAGVDLFFAISGFVMTLLIAGRFRSGREAGRFLWRRATRIYPPYWFYTLLILAVWAVRPAWVNSSQGGLPDLAASFLLLPAEGLPVLMVGWTLVHEAYFYLAIAGLMLALPERLFPLGLLAWGAATAAVGLLAGPEPGAALRLLASPLTCEFIAGCFVALAWRRLPPALPGARAKAAWGAAGILALAAAGLVSHHRLTGTLFPQGWARAALLGLPAAGLLFAALLAERGGSPRWPRWAVAVGDASYSTYLSHVLVLSALGRLWGSFSRPGPWDNLTALPLLLLAALGAGWISYRVLERPVLAWFRRGKPARYLSTAAKAPPSTEIS